MSMFRTPRYIHGGNLTSNNFIPGLGFLGGADQVISGNSVLCDFEATNGFAAGNSLENQYFGLTPLDFHAIFPMVIIGGADTVVSAVSLNGTPGKVVCQTNIAGYIAAILTVPFVQSIGGNMRPSSISPGKILVNTTGTAPTSANVGLSCWLLRYPEVDWADVSSTAADTARTLTIPTVTDGHRIIAAAINDVSAANACTWSGTAGVSETDDGSVGTARRSYSQGRSGTGTSRTVIATFDVISTTGIALAAAMFRLK